LFQVIILGLDEVLVDFFLGLELDLAFLGVELISCDFYRCQVVETSDACFYGSVEFETSSLVDLHI